MIWNNSRTAHEVYIYMFTCKIMVVLFPVCNVGRACKIVVEGTQVTVNLAMTELVSYLVRLLGGLPYYRV
jgi:hypothetical protein